MKLTIIACRSPEERVCVGPYHQYIAIDSMGTLHISYDLANRFYIGEKVWTMKSHMLCGLFGLQAFYPETVFDALNEWKVRFYNKLLDEVKIKKSMSLDRWLLLAKLTQYVNTHRPPSANMPGHDVNFEEHLRMASSKVVKWPEWKQNETHRGQR